MLPTVDPPARIRKRDVYAPGPVSAARWESLVAEAIARAAALQAVEDAVANGLVSCRPDSPAAAGSAAEVPAGADPYAVAAWLSERDARAVTAGRGVQVADGDYAGVMPIRTRHWEAQLIEWLASPQGDAARRQCAVGADMVRWVAADETAHADYNTGRELRTSHAAVARRLSARGEVLARRPRGITAAAVHRVRWFLQVNGWQESIRTGRYLRAGERAAIRARTGRKQLLGASVRALTTPTGRDLVQARAAAADHQVRARYARLKRLMGASVRGVSSRQPRSGAGRGSLQGSCGDHARKRAGATRSTTRTTHDPMPLQAQRLAAALLARTPRLTNARTRPLVEAVAPLAEHGWTAYDVQSTIDAYDRDHDLPPVQVDSQRNPLGLLIHRIRRACAPGPRPTSTPRPPAAVGLRLPDTSTVPETTQPAVTMHASTAYLQYRSRTDRPARTQAPARVTEHNLAQARRGGSLGTRYQQHLLDTTGGRTITAAVVQ